MKALSIIGIVISLAGILCGIYVMTEGKCYCYSSSDFGYNSDYTDSDVTMGSSIFILISIFFLVFSIIAAIVSFRKNGPPPPVMPYPNYQQPYNPQQPYNQQQPYQPYNPMYPQQPNNPQNPNYYQQPPQQPPYNPGDSYKQ